jgi:hypothetical protein
MEHTEWQRRTLSGVHSIMMEKLAQAGGGALYPVYNVQYTVPGVAPLQGVKNVSTPRLTLHCTWGYNVEYTVPGVAPLQGVKNVSTLDPTL